MTRAAIEHKDGKVRVEIIDHAGDPTVCAGISALVNATLLALQGLGTPIEMEAYEGGKIIFTADLPGQRQMAAIDVLTTGLKGIAQEYPEHLGVTLRADTSV